MRKWIAVLALVILTVILSYVLIPSEIKLDRSFVAKAYQATIYRGLTDDQLLQQWIKPSGKTDSGRIVYTADQTSMVFRKAVTDLVYIKLSRKDETIESYMHIIPLNNDSSSLTWSATYPASKNPFVRIADYFSSQRLKRDLGTAIMQFQKYIGDEEQVYGVKVKGGKVADTLLVTTKTEVTGFPSPPVYYEMIGKLKTYIAEQGALETNFPMLNITPLGGDKYETRVAIPLNKVVPENSTIAFKRMFPGKILIAEVKGGPAAVNNSLVQMNNYLTEHQLMAPAIPFQSLVTDRLRETDSSKWVTRLYFPVY